MSTLSQTDALTIQQLVGSIVLITQDAERCLKLTLPFLGDSATPHKDITKQLDALQKRTLGELTGKLVDSVTSDSLDFAQHMAYLVSTRNKVVHHFHETYGAQLGSGAHSEVIASLAACRRNLKGLRSVLQQIALLVFEGLRDVTFQGTPEYEHFAQLCATFRQHIES